MVKRWIAELALVIAVGAPDATAAPSTHAVPRFRPVEIDAQVGIGYGVAVADIDGDAKPDIVLADRDLVAWYRNPSWSKQVIARRLTQHDHVCVAAADVDGDGKAEIAVGAEWNPSDTVGSGALFFLAPPADRSQPWEPVRLPHEPTVHRIRWVRDWQGRTTLVSVPLHGRGNDARLGEGAGVKIQRYIPPQEASDAWEIQLIDDQLHKTHNFDPVQWDDDPAEELLIAAKEGVFLSNWSSAENRLTLTQIASGDLGGAGEVRGLHGTRSVAAIEPMHGQHLTLHTPATSPAGETRWTRQVLDSTLREGHALACGDLLGLGFDQIVVGWRGTDRAAGINPGIKMFTRIGAGGQEWQPTVIDDGGMACEDLCLADLDGDGRLDIIAAGRATRNLKVYFNETPRED